MDFEPMEATIVLPRIVANRSHRNLSLNPSFWLDILSCVLFAENIILVVTVNGRAVFDRNANSSTRNPERKRNISDDDDDETSVCIRRYKKAVVCLEFRRSFLEDSERRRISMIVMIVNEPIYYIVLALKSNVQRTRLRVCVATMATGISGFV